MKLFILLGSIIIMIVAFMTIGFLNTILVAASGAGAYWYYKQMSKGAAYA